MVTGDFLFEPRKGESYDKNDDHLAQMIELLNSIPKTLAYTGPHFKRFFSSSGMLRNIQGLHFWSLKNVLMEKYRFKEIEAQALTDFLLPMLELDPQKRATAQQMLDHPWLFMPPAYETKMKEKEYKHMSFLRKLNDPEEGESESASSSPTRGIGKIGASTEEMQYADVESATSGSSPKSKKKSKGKKDQHSESSEDEDEAEDYYDSSSNKYGPNSPLLNIDHGPNPQFS